MSLKRVAMLVAMAAGVAFLVLLVDRKSGGKLSGTLAKIPVLGSMLA